MIGYVGQEISSGRKPNGATSYPANGTPFEITAIGLVVWWVRVTGPPSAPPERFNDVLLDADGGSTKPRVPNGRRG